MIGVVGNSDINYLSLRNLNSSEFFENLTNNKASYNISNDSSMCPNFINNNVNEFDIDQQSPCCIKKNLFKKIIL